MLLDLGQESPESAWPLEKVKAHPEGYHITLWFALMRRMFLKMKLRYLRPEILVLLYDASEDLILCLQL